MNYKYIAHPFLFDILAIPIYSCDFGCFSKHGQAYIHVHVRVGIVFGLQLNLFKVYIGPGVLYSF